MKLRFLCLFVDTLPVNTYLHIWDAFLFEGSKVRLLAFVLSVFVQMCKLYLIECKPLFGGYFL